MQNFARTSAMMLALSLVFPGLATTGDAAAIRPFEVDYGWDAGGAYDRPEPPRALSFPPMNAEVPIEAISGAALPPRPTFVVQAPSLRETVAVPVPGALGLFGSGLALLAVVSRRRSRRRTS